MKNLLVAIVILATPITQAQLTAEQKEEQLRDRRPHRVLNQITYDESENQIKVANNVNSATGQKPRITIFEFDEKNRIKSETNAYYRLKKTYTYEKSKIIERIEHGGGTTIVILLDDFGREIKRSFKYDDRPKVDVTITEYSEDGLEKKTSYDDGRVHTERFDRQGNRLFFSNKAPDGSTDLVCFTRQNPKK